MSRGASPIRLIARSDTGHLTTVAACTSQHGPTSCERSGRVWREHGERVVRRERRFAEGSDEGVAWSGQVETSAQMRHRLHRLQQRFRRRLVSAARNKKNSFSTLLRENRRDKPCFEEERDGREHAAPRRRDEFALQRPCKHKPMHSPTLQPCKLLSAHAKHTTT